MYDCTLFFVIVAKRHAQMPANAPKPEEALDSSHGNVQQHLLVQRRVRHQRRAGGVPGGVRWLDPWRDWDAVPTLDHC
jgi:hypothetical protein